MKAGELRGKKPDELRKQLEDLRRESLNLRFQASSGELQNTSARRRVRRDIARVKTVLGDQARAEQAG